MPRMSGSAVAIAAGAISANQVAGQQWEFLPRGARYLLAAVGSAAGINVSLIIGGISLINDQPISGANRFPILPDDAVNGGRGGGRVILTFRNTTGGALTFNWTFDVG